VRGFFIFAVGMLLGIACGFVFEQSTNTIIFSFVLGIGIGIAYAIFKK
jgi:cyanate permease